MLRFVGIAVTSLVLLGAGVAPAFASSSPAATPVAPPVYSAGTSGWHESALITQPTVNVNTPNAFAADGRYMLAVMSNPTPSARGTVAMIDTATHKQVAEVTVGWQPHAITKVGSQFWVGNNDGTISILRQSGTGLENVGQFTVGSKYLVTMTPDDAGDVWVLSDINSSDGAQPLLTKVDASTHQIEASYPGFISGVANGMTYANGRLFVYSKLDGPGSAVTAIDPATGKPIWQKTFEGTLSAIAAGKNGNLWLASGTANQVIELSPVDGTSLAGYTLPGEPDGLAITHSEQLLVTLCQTDQMAAIDLGTGKVVTQGASTGGAFSARIAVDDSGNAWIGNLEWAPGQPAGGSISVMTAS